MGRTGLAAGFSSQRASIADRFIRNQHDGVHVGLCKRKDALTDPPRSK